MHWGRGRDQGGQRETWELVLVLLLGGINKSGGLVKNGWFFSD